MEQKTQPGISNTEIVDFLSTTTANATFLQKLKILYRPYVCPFDELLDYSKDVASVYDVGCGSGQFCALVAKFSNVTDIHGIEIDDHLVKNAAEINSMFSPEKSVTFSVFDGSDIPENIGNYDLVYMIDVYHHIPKKVREAFMVQLYEKMKPGARLMFKDINGASPFVVLNKVHDLIFAQELSHEIGFNKAQNFLKSIGFKVVEARKKRVFIYPHYFILAEK